MRPQLLLMSLGLGLVLQGCSSPKTSMPTERPRTSAEMSDAYTNALAFLSADWPGTVGAADSIMERLGFSSPIHKEPIGRDYELRDSLGDMSVLMQLGIRSAIANYTPKHEVEFSEEVLRGLREKCKTSSYEPPDLLIYHFEDSMGEWSVVTDVTVGMPRGVWRSTITQLHPIRR